MEEKATGKLSPEQSKKMDEATARLVAAAEKEIEALGQEPFCVAAVLHATCISAAAKHGATKSLGFLILETGCAILGFKFSATTISAGYAHSDVPPASVH